MTSKKDNKETELVIKVCGECMLVNKTDNFRETMKKILKEKGITVYSIVIDGTEMDATTLVPETFQELQTVEVNRQVIAGR